MKKINFQITEVKEMLLKGIFSSMKSEKNLERDGRDRDSSTFRDF